jgi:tetratricopeptide (TPR) repeat protein
MNRTIKIAFGVGGVILVGVLVVLALWYQGMLGGSEYRYYRLIKNNPKLVSVYNEAKKAEANIRQSPDSVKDYLNAGIAWKGLGDQSPENKNIFYAKAREVYGAGIKRFGAKNIIFYLNDGNVAELMGDYSGAEADYKKAIEISVADESGYIGLASLYDYKLHKSKEEIVAVYSQGIAKMYDPTPLVAARGSYLRRVGDAKGALPDYQYLVKKFPTNTGYQQIVAELKAKITAGS